MKTTLLNSSEGLKGFSKTFSIFSLVKKEWKKNQTLQTLQGAPVEIEPESVPPLHRPDSIDAPFEGEILRDQTVTRDETPSARQTISKQCTVCSRLETITVLDEPIHGCLYLAAGPYFDGWRRLPPAMEACLWI